MGIIKVQAFEAGPSKSGISIAQGESKGRVFFRLGITAAAQIELLGRLVDPNKDAISLIVTNDPGRNHLMGIRIVSAGDAAGIPVSGGPHGSVGMKLGPWRATGPGKRPPVSLIVINRQVEGGGISVKLPDWARPEIDIAAGAKR